MMEQYCNPVYKVDIVVYKKYLEESVSNALLETILMDPRHMKNPLVTKAGERNENRKYFTGRIARNEV